MEPRTAAEGEPETVGLGALISTPGEHRNHLLSGVVKVGLMGSLASGKSDGVFSLSGADLGGVSFAILTVEDEYCRSTTGYFIGIGDTNYRIK